MSKNIAMNKASISCDVISSTALSMDDRQLIDSRIRRLLDILKDKYSDINFFARISKGDYIECAMDDPKFSLRIALILKTLIKSMELESANKRDMKTKYFKEHGVRAAVAVASLLKIDGELDIIDGEAIYLSGRALHKQETYGKDKVIIKNTLFFLSTDKDLEERLEPVFCLLDTLISKCSSKQSEVLYFKLLGMSEENIAERLGKTQATINQHSRSGGWNAIETAVSYFERVVK